MPAVRFLSTSRLAEPAHQTRTRKDPCFFGRFFVSSCRVANIKSMFYHINKDLYKADRQHFNPNTNTNPNPNPKPIPQNCT